MSSEVKEESPFSRRPENTPFKQQALPAWQPLLTPNWVIFTFAVVGCIFLPIGVIIIVKSSDVVELVQRYDNMPTTAGQVVVSFNVPATMNPPIYVYYQLTNFYQNHRRYVKSRSDVQLQGSPLSTSGCTPMSTSADGKILYPCGLVANSFFNDTFTVAYKNATGTNFFPAALTKSGIAWSSDLREKFKEPSGNYSGQVSRMSPFGFTLPNVTDEDFVVWMRTAGLPTFRKLYRKIESDTFGVGAVVNVTVTSNYPVASFDGQKAVVLTTTTALGGKNDFLGWCYIGVGVLCFLLAIGFFIKQSVAPRRLGDMSYFHWAGSVGKREGAEAD